MIIKEGSTIKLMAGASDGTVLDEIIANEDIEIENNGRGYTILLRTEGYDSNNIFESDEIKKVDEENYIIQGYFKDALLVLRSGRNFGMYESYMAYDD